MIGLAVTFVFPMSAWMSSKPLYHTKHNGNSTRNFSVSQSYFTLLSMHPTILSAIKPPSHSPVLASSSHSSSDTCQFNTERTSRSKLRAFLLKKSMRRTARKR